MARAFPREGSGRRRGPFREPARTLLIVCGSRETERQYLQGLKDHVRNPAVSVVFRAKVCAPSQLVEYARKLREQNRAGYDDVWCVVDVDEFTDLPKKEGVEAAALRAQKLDPTGEDHARNPSTNVWLLTRSIIER